MASVPNGSGSQRRPLAETVLVSADQLLSTPLLYIDRYYPLREAEWVRLRQVSAWWTAVGAVLGVVLTTVVPLGRQYIIGTGISHESKLDLIIEAGLLGPRLPDVVGLRSAQTSICQQDIRLF